MPVKGRGPRPWTPHLKGTRKRTYRTRQGRRGVRPKYAFVEVAVNQREGRTPVPSVGPTEGGFTQLGGLATQLSHALEALPIKKGLEFRHEDCREIATLQIEPDLIQRIVWRTGLGAPVHAGHDEVVAIPGEDFAWS
jgi:hypothetical protein